MTNPQSVMFQAPPSEHNVANVISSQSKTLYLNKPRNHKEDDEVPQDTDKVTQEDGKNSSEPNHDWQKRYSDLKSYHDKTLKAKDDDINEKARLLVEKEKLLEATKTEQTLKVPSTPEEIEAFKLKYPALYNVIETISVQKNLSTKTQLEKAIKENEAVTKSLAAEKARSELVEIHPDAMSLKNDPEFIDWYQSQVSYIKSLIESDRVVDIARGIDIYKKDKGIITKSKSQKDAEVRAAAMAVNTKPFVEVGGGVGKIWKASEVKAIPNSQYHKYEAEILKALADGRYDENS